MPGIEGLDQTQHQVALADFLALVEDDDVLVVVGRVSCTVDAGDRADHNHVPPPGKQAGQGAEAEFFYLLVDGKVFFYIGVRSRKIGFGLVIVVIGDVVFYGVVGKELLEFPEELGRQGFVVAQNQCRAFEPGYRVGDGEGFPRTGHPEQDLRLVAMLYAGNELVDGLGLVAGGLELGGQFEVHEFVSLKIKRVACILPVLTRRLLSLRSSNKYVPVRLRSCALYLARLIRRFRQRLSI